MREVVNLLPKKYKKIGLTFFALSVIVLGLTGYSLLGRVRIIITPGLEKINQEFVFKVIEMPAGEKPVSADTVNGIISSAAVEGSIPAKATGAIQVAQSDIVGEVTIVNNYSKSQDLVATTRLADPKDPKTVILRLKKTVTVPAGQSVKVPVYADSPASFTALAPGRLIIPGLWEPLWDKIYAENNMTLSKDGFSLPVVTEQDQKDAETRLRDQLYQQGKSGTEQSADSLWPKLITTKVESVSFDAKPGDQASEFNASMKLQVVSISFDESQVIDLAREKIKAESPNSKKIIDLDPKSFSYSIVNFDAAAKTAEIKAVFTGNSTISELSSIINKQELVNLNADEVKEYLSQFSEIKDVELKFTPAWQKTVPAQIDKISIEVAE